MGDKMGAPFDGVYKVDLLKPEANGQPHYIQQDGDAVTHLYLGKKHGKSCWVVDESLSPDETSGCAFVEVVSGTALPYGEAVWQCFDGSGHVARSILIRCA